MNKMLAVFMFLAASTISYSEVVVVEDGTVYLGKISSIDSRNITIESFGNKDILPIKAILSNNGDVSSISKIRMDIILKDESRVSGFIENYDEEIGVLVNMGFGSLTIPVNSIKIINDPAARKNHLGSPFRFGVNVSGYMVAGKLSDEYDPSFKISSYGEFAVSRFRGLALGADLSYNYVRYKTDSDMKFSIFSLKPYVMYSFLDFKKTAPLFSSVTPFAAVYAGLASVSLNDKRSFAKSDKKNEIDPELSAALGLDISMTNHVSIRLACGYSMIIQKEDSLTSVEFVVGANYGF